MKKINTLIAVLITVFSMSINAQDTVGYWGFENETTWGPHGSVWNNEGKTWVREIIVDDADNAYSGNAYFKAVVGEAPENHWDNQAVYQEIPIKDKTSYRFQMRMRADAESGFEPSINMTCGTYNGWKEITAKYSTVIGDEWDKYVMMVWVDNTEDLDLIDENGRYQDTIRFPMSYPVPGTYFVDDVAILKSTIAGITFNANILAVDYGYAIDYIPSVSPSAYTITVNGETIAATSAGMYLTDGGTNLEPKIYMELSSAIPNDAVVTVAYDGGEELYYSSVSPTEDFLAAEFTNEAAEYNAYLEIPAVGILSNAAKATFEVYPNPAFNKVTIENKEIVSSISIYNVTGKLIKSIVPSSLVTSVDISELTKGVYMIQVTDKKGNTSAKKLLK